MGKNIFKSNQYIQKNPKKSIVFGFLKLFDNVLSMVIGALRARSLVPVQLRQQVTFLELSVHQRDPRSRCFLTRRRRKTTEISVLIVEKKTVLKHCSVDRGDTGSTRGYCKKSVCSGLSLWGVPLCRLQTRSYR